MTTSTNTAAATPAQDLPEVANLRETRKAQAAAKRTKAPAKAAPAKKAAAKPKAEKPAEKAAAKPKIKWTIDGERDAKGRVAQHGESADGTVYQITGAGDQWKATVTPPDGKPEVLGDGVGHTKAYTLCTAHAKGAHAAMTT